MNIIETVALETSFISNHADLKKNIIYTQL
jgi:hypothetical protein